MIGDVIGNFQLLEQLGHGGMGAVYLGEHVRAHTKVAVKVLHAHISEDEEQVARFFNEAKIVGKIKHAGIVQIFDSGKHEGHAYLIMELLDGESLHARLKRGALALPKLADVAQQIASVLDATHRAGITHRDLKPENIYLVPDAERASGERVKVLDFGIAKLSGTLAGGAPKTHGTMGTPAYMAPEQWGDSSAVDGRADAYSLGCVAFEMACGRVPFVARNIAEAYAKHLNDAPPSVRALAPGMPPELDAVLAKLLAKTPAERPASMADIAAMFARLGGLEVTAATSSPALVTGDASLAETIGKVTPLSTATTMGSSLGELTRAPARPHARRRVAAAVVAGGVAVIAVVIGGVVMSSSSPSPSSPSSPSSPTMSAAPVQPPVARPAVAKPDVPVQPPPQPPVVEAPVVTPPPPPPPVVHPKTKVTIKPPATTHPVAQPPVVTPPPPPKGSDSALDGRT
nr:serine/threonine-protein kinase [Kofleriaceae bacterium]